MEPLDFGTADTVDLSTEKPTQQDNAEIHRYDTITDVQDKRKQVLVDIKNGTLDAKNYPTIMKKFSEIITKLPDGRFMYSSPKSNYEQSLRTKLITFIHTGKLGDALASNSMGEVKRIAKDIAEEILRYIPLDYSHPMRKIMSLYKNGTLQEIIDFNLKKKHYDLFDKSWYNSTVNPLVMEYITHFRKTDKAELRGEFKESLENIKNKLKTIYG
jgi:hypothetical protein